MKIVMKFGGTSLSTASRVSIVARIVKRWSQDNRVVIVASAMDDVTDRLVQLGEEAKRGNIRGAKIILSKIREFHLQMARHAVRKAGPQQTLLRLLRELLFDLDKTVESVLQLRELTSRSLDYLMSFGERLSVPILAAALDNVALEAKALTGFEAGIVTDENFGEARPLSEVSFHQIQERLDPILERGVVPVVTGFVAASTDGTTTTLGRGGSDYTATLIGVALGADEILIWTDVDGLMTADPRIVKDAKVLPRVSFREAMELSYFGAKMMHPRALQPASQKKIPVRFKNTFRPLREGTLVTFDDPGNSRVVRAVSIIRAVGVVTVEGSGMMGTPGVAATVFGILGSNRINVVMISQGSSEASISCVVLRKDVDRAVRVLQLALLGHGYVERVVEEKDVCIVAVVGSGMRGAPGVAARIFQSVARQDVNVRMIAQGSSEYNISFVVSESDGPKAVRAIHEEFKLASIL